jgi:hypothetical protein
VGRRIEVSNETSIPSGGITDRTDGEGRKIDDSYEIERDDDGVLITDIGRGEGGSVETIDDDTTIRDVEIITDVDSSVEAGRDERRLKSSVTDDSVVSGGS